MRTLLLLHTVLLVAGTTSALRVSSSLFVRSRAPCSVRMQDDEPHPWSASAALSDFVAPNDADTSLPPLPAEVAPSTAREPREVIMIVLNALRNPDEPYENYGPQVAIEHSAPTNGASKLSPGQFAEYLNEPSYQILTEWDEVEMEDDLDIDDDGEHAYQDVMVKRTDDPSWTHINWNLVKVQGMWMSESVVTY
eukprot:CAMPEP_0206054668 /NCGR_PEP_ID=MMETSP1466-20131121/38577_1 /ASSEMBLY_ACC=CAM_ASM_001126 /TAXON_ID=44452 /ORGANISM="Pavlova gyrans, Strain CCMP608" /LENGTH=193 /DNA_ID=CAMNT_0053429883 /DNA_START=17 /DNA_END=598 /DNA_ORIENTATION=+